MFAPCISMLIGKHVVTMTAMFLHTLHEKSLRGKLQTCAKWNYPICYVFHVYNRHWQKRNFCQQIMPIQTWNCTCHRNNHWSLADDFEEVERIAVVNFSSACAFTSALNMRTEPRTSMSQQNFWISVSSSTHGIWVCSQTRADMQFIHGAAVDMQHSRQQLTYLYCLCYPMSFGVKS